MNEENQVSYYSVIPATVRYDIRLKAAEKLIYGEITSLTNKKGYCYATNKYFADLYSVTSHTVSQWISHLDKLGYIHIELIKNVKKEIEERRIYIRDIPYVQKNTYPYVLKSTYPMYKKVQENNKIYNKDDLFYLIINNSKEIPDQFYLVLKRLELDYGENHLLFIKTENIQMIKNIIFVLYELYVSEYDSILSKVSRESLFNLYQLCKEHYPNDLLNYYRKAIINKYTN